MSRISRQVEEGGDGWRPTFLQGWVKSLKGGDVDYDAFGAFAALEVIIGDVADELK